MKFLAAILVVPALAFAQTEPKLIYEEDPRLLTTAIRIVATTGGQEDLPQLSGLTNLMAELMLRGTKTKSREKFQSEIERLGGTFSVSTTNDTINFDARVIRENLVPFLKLIEEALLRPAFAPKEFASVKRELLNGIKNKKNANPRLAGLAVRRTLFAGTSLERPTDGGLETVGRIKLADVQRAYKERIHRGNVFFAVASANPETEIKKRVTEIWMGLAEGVRTPQRAIPFTAPEKATLVVVQKKDTSTGSLMMGQPGIVADDPQRFELSLGNFSFGSEPLVSRLFRVIRSDLGWTYQIGTTYHAMGGLNAQKGLFVISATPSVEFTAKAILKAKSMWTTYLADGLKSPEIELARLSLVNSYPFEFESAESRLGRKIHSYLYGVPVLTPAQYAKQLEAIGNKELVSALKAHHTPNGWVIAVVADAKTFEKQLADEQKEIPEAERLTISKVWQPDEIIK